MNACDRFREAFDRLRNGVPLLLPQGSKVTQNNVAKEAGKRPSALKKARYPALICEIQMWIAQNASPSTSAQPNSERDRRRRNRSVRQQLAALRAERDIAVSMLVEADLLIVDLKAEVATLKGAKDNAALDTRPKALQDGAIS